MIIEQKKATFKIDTEVVTPVLQIEPTASSDKDLNTKASMVRTKKRTIVLNGKTFKVPYFSANGLRGIMRRNLAATIFSTLENKDGKKMNVKNLHLYSSGGSTSNDGISDLNYVQKEELRENNPFISIFGAGLSDIDGKLSVSDLAFDLDSLDEAQIKKLVDSSYGVRFDETQRNSIMSPLLDASAIEKYTTELNELRASNKQARKLEDEIKKLKELDDKSQAEITELEEKEIKLASLIEEKGMSYQQVYKSENISIGSKLYSSVAPRAGYDFNELEKAVILYGLLLTSKQCIGSWARVGYGALKWHIRDEDGETLFKTTPNPKYTLSSEIEVTELGNKILAPLDDYLENLNRENIEF
jgi:CRISPR type IV-associated protein Csf2